MLRVFIYCLALFSLAACHREPPVKQPRPVRVSVADGQSAVGGSPYSAVVTPYTQVNVAFRTNGYIEEISSREALGEVRILQAGDYVADRQILAKVNDEQYRDKVIEAVARVSEAEATRRKADLDFRRATILFAAASITAPDYDTARQEYEVSQAAVVGAKAQLDRAEEALNDTVLRSPLSGVILQRRIEVGTLVHPETVGFVVADVFRVKVVFSVPDIVLKDAKPGSVVTMRTESFPHQVFSGQVTEVAPQADQRTRVFAITVTLPNHNALLKTGMIMSLILDKAKIPPNQVVIPLSCLVTESVGGTGFAVFVLESDQGVLRARRRSVISGRVLGNDIAILQGLTAGERVVSTGAAQLQDGQPVTVVP
ncbi:efflux RND transporter periplasmic adaptor subunit [Microbulbifer sp. 2304DJ12-6]|uniref:efflux RND transporter periplasmic adaptor subunit n=1 Tax=Microbulbifer sp. 2304DJ12-6 TaxID=3233340 RepID=UPI0039AEB873